MADGLVADDIELGTIRCGSHDSSSIGGKRTKCTSYKQFLWYCFWPEDWHRDLSDIGGRESLLQPRLFEGLIDDNGHSWRPSTCAQSLLMVAPGTHPIQVAPIMCKHRNIHVDTVICDLIERGLVTQSTGLGC